MNKRPTIKLGVNIDHVATLRQARGGTEPDVLEAALIAIESGADSITVHLREDRRHIQDHDVQALRQQANLILNLEMAATAEMIAIAKKTKPDYCCIVPEKRQELTTEGGLDVISSTSKIKELCSSLHEQEIQISLFVDPNDEQIKAASKCGADMVEIHTGHYANLENKTGELDKIIQSSELAAQLGLQVNAGHGLTIDNVVPIAKIPEVIELNIGHSIVSRALFIGLDNAVREMKKTMESARQ